MHFQQFMLDGIGQIWALIGVDSVEAETGLVESASFGKNDKVDRPAGSQLSVDGGREAVCMRIPFGRVNQGPDIDLAG